MKKALLIIAIVGACLLLIGGAILAICISKMDWNLDALSDTVYMEQTASFAANDVREIVVDVHTEKVLILPSEDDDITVQYYILKDKKDNVLRQVIPALEGDVLRCVEEQVDASGGRFAFSHQEKLVVKVPADKVLAYTVKVTTGDVCIGEDGKTRHASTLDINATTGSVTLRGNTVCEGNMDVKVTTGSVTFAGAVECGGNASIRTSTGKIKINEPLTASGVALTTTTGDIICGGVMRCDNLTAQATTGDVSLRLAGDKAQYSYIYETSTGKSNVSAFTLGDKRIDVRTTTGDIDVDFVG